MSLSRRSFLQLSGVAAGLLLHPRPAQTARRLVRGLYFPAYRLAEPDAVAVFQDTVLRAGANAVVVDVKDEGGVVHIPFDHPLKPTREPRHAYLEQVTDLLNWCRAQGVRPVARQVVFQDGWLAYAHPGHALLDHEGEVWRDADGRGRAYTDPFSDAVHDYNAAVAETAARLGFDEVQFDYLRFPTGQVSGIAWRQAWTFENRTAAIARFVATAAPRVRTAGASASADVFGITAWKEQRDAGIGQYLESLAPHIDALCPMAYPSTYGSGIPDCPDGCKPGPAYPFEIVYHTTRLALTRTFVVAPHVKVTPWTQAFGDYLFSLPFGLPEYWAQQQGALVAGAGGVYCWESAGQYPADVFLPVNAPAGAIPVRQVSSSGRGGIKPGIAFD